jgi:hypothetical protein
MSEVKPVRKVARRKSVHYINNRDFWDAFVAHRANEELCKEAGLPPPQLPRYIGEAFMQICNKLGFKFNFINYSYRDEMIGDAIENCVAAAHNFDPNKSTNPFSYFTMVAWNAFIRRIGREKKQAYIKYKNINNGLLNDLLVELQNGDDSHRNRHNTQVFNDSMSKVVESFESKLKLTKNKKKSNVGIEKFLPQDEEVAKTSVVEALDPLEGTVNA